MLIKLSNDAQDLFENLQLTSTSHGHALSETVDSGAWALTGNGAGVLCRRQPDEVKSQVQSTADRELAKLLYMAVSMQLATQTHKGKHIATPSIDIDLQIDLPAPVRFSRANRKLAALKEL